MGCSLIKISKDSYPENTNTHYVIKNDVNTVGNPDPKRYNLLRYATVNDYLVVKLRYIDCLNYEGIKILVFDKGVTIEALINQKLIDPHFSDKKEYISPIARFEPTDRGWQMAVKFIKGL